MWRDPLDELIEDLEGIFPAARASECDIPGKFFEMVERFERKSELERQRERRARSTIATVPAVWPAKPARRPDPSAPWDYSGQSDSDDSDG